MPLETAQYIHQLNPANPASADRLQQGDDHLRMIKSTLKATFPKIDGPVQATTKFLNETVPAGLVPYGTITLFVGNTAPVGWAICNGQTVEKSDGSGNVTVPDLRGRVGVGATDASKPGTAFGQTSRTVTSEAGGAHTPSGRLPAHQHDFSATGNTGSNATGISLLFTAFRGYAGGGSQSAVAAGSNGTPPSLTDSGHAHSVTVSGKTAVQPAAIALEMDSVIGHSHAVTVDVTQPSLSLHYIMKI